MQSYKPKSLVNGSRLGLDENKMYVAVPDKFAGKQLQVEYNNTVKIIKDWKGEAQLFRRFRDKFWKPNNGRSQHYTLGYYEFKEK